MLKIPKPTALSIKANPKEIFRFAIEYEGTITNTNRLKNFKSFQSKESEPKRVSFIVSKNSSYWEPLGANKKEIRSNDILADRFLNTFRSDNKNAKITKVYFFREAGSEVSIFDPIKKIAEKTTKTIEKAESTSQNILYAVIVGGIIIAVLSSKRKK